MRYFILAVMPVILLCAACHETASHKDNEPLTVATQVQHGKQVFAANCARCHGDAGQGKKGPPLVGADALPLDPRPSQKLRKQQFHTALDVANFVTHNMPPDPDDRSKLRENDYWAVLAFDLNANGVALNQPVGPGNAASIVLHP